MEAAAGKQALPGAQVSAMLLPLHASLFPSKVYLWNNIFQIFIMSRDKSSSARIYLSVSHLHSVYGDVWEDFVYWAESELCVAYTPLTTLQGICIVLSG